MTTIGRMDDNRECHVTFANRPLLGEFVTDAMSEDYPYVVGLTLKGSGATDAEIHQIKGLVHLEVIELFGTSISAEGIDQIQREFPNATVLVRKKWVK